MSRIMEFDFYLDIKCFFCKITRTQHNFSDYIIYVCLYLFDASIYRKSLQISV